MKIDKPENPNYCGTVVEIKNIVPLENCDNVVATTIFGFQAIVSKSTKIGDIGIVFPAETQLSDEFCYENNLYRHADKNRNEGEKGYLEDNRRIKAVKFRGNPSSCLFMSLDSVKFTGIKPELLNVGDEFDILNGKEVCRKYVVLRKIPRKFESKQLKQFVRVDSIHMPEHYDSSNYFKWGDTISGDKTVIITQKLHGTSIRVGHTLAKRKLNLFEKLLSRTGVKIQPTVHDYIYASRKVIKDINNPYHNHFYGSDIWTAQGKKLVGILPENFIVYGELVGWTAENTEIQKNYSYSIPQGQAELYIYRIAIVNAQGHLTDLSWEQVKEFCKKNGLNHVPELWIGLKSEFDTKIKEFVDVRFFENGYKNCLYIGEDMNLVDEGVCVRVDGMIPTIFKAKSPKFLEHESAILDTGVEDLESTQSVIENVTA